MAKHNETGAAGERLAEDFLRGKGYEIHFRNWRKGRREVDLIASFDNQWVFVEVKTRRASNYGFPEDAVDSRKKVLLREAADAFLWENRQFPTLRYDVVSVQLRDGAAAEILHFEDAFY